MSKLLETIGIFESDIKKKFFHLRKCKHTLSARVNILKIGSTRIVCYYQCSFEKNENLW